MEIEYKGQRIYVYLKDIEERCEKFFKIRFQRDPEKDEAYYNEWLGRFISGVPDRFMDPLSLKVYLEIIIREHSNTTVKKKGKRKKVRK
jgi:hypothetical protein